jgi:hypothetical protein
MIGQGREQGSAHRWTLERGEGEDGASPYCGSVTHGIEDGSQPFDGAHGLCGDRSDGRNGGLATECVRVGPSSRGEVWHGRRCATFAERPCSHLDNFGCGIRQHRDQVRAGVVCCYLCGATAHAYGGIAQTASQIRRADRPHPGQSAERAGPDTGEGIGETRPGRCLVVVVTGQSYRAPRADGRTLVDRSPWEP